MRGVLWAAGAGSRLWPITRAVPEQLMPVYDKPMIFYPLSTLITSGVREVLVVTRPGERRQFRHLLRDGSQWGLRIEYAVQGGPAGAAQAFTIGADFLAGEPVALILGDTIFHGAALERRLPDPAEIDGALIFGLPVADQRAYEVVALDPDGEVLGVGSAPATPRFRYAVPGLYFYDPHVVKIAADLWPGPGGELRIADINAEYLRRGQLRARLLERGTAWLDTGRFSDLVAAAQYVRIIEERQGIKVGCVEEAAWRAGLIGDAALRKLAGPLRSSGYGDYLLRLLDGGAEQ